MNYRRLLVFTLSLFIVTAVTAQDNKELSRQLVEIGDEILNFTLAYEQAREQYLAAIEADPENLAANYMAGEMFLLSVDKGRARKYFLKANGLDPDYKFDLLFKIGLANHYEYRFDEAIDYYKQYINKFDAQPGYTGADRILKNVVERKIYECGVGKELIKNPRNVSIVNLGSNVNSEYDDYAPVLNRDETLMIFTSRRMDENISQDVHTDNLPFEDIFYSVKFDSVWHPAVNIGSKINTPAHDSNLGLSKDGSKLYVYNSDINNGDIFISVIDPDGFWSEPTRLPEPINSESNENGVSLSEDGNWMFFSSNRPGGLGGDDIYVSERNGTRGWKRPKNLGPVINTPNNEEGPFIGYDGKSLYFSSDGGRGMGGFDIFKSEYDSANGVWGFPTNLGYPINTPDQDVHFTVTEDGFRAYYATTREDGFGFTDLYEITFIDDKAKILNLPLERALVPVTVMVYVIDADSQKPIDTRVKLMETETNIEITPTLFGSAITFIITDNNTKEYMLSTENVGFGFYNQKITLPGASSDTIVLERTIKLKKLERGYSKVLRNLYFDFDKTVLKDESYTELNKLNNMMIENPGLKIGLVGFTDDVGTEKYNTDLSKRRALAVKNFLSSKGIDIRRIKTGGLGTRFPIASNDDEEEGRALNRRVEMAVISNN